MEGLRRASQQSNKEPGDLFRNTQNSVTPLQKRKSRSVSTELCVGTAPWLALKTQSCDDPIVLTRAFVTFSHHSPGSSQQGASDQNARNSCASGGVFYVLTWIRLVADSVSLFCVGC